MTPSIKQESHQHKDRLNDWLLRWLVLSLLVWGTGQTGIWNGLTFNLYDRLKQWSAQLVEPEFQVLLMEGSPNLFEYPPQQWNQLLQRLLALDAEQILLLNLPQQFDFSTLPSPLMDGRIVLGRHAHYHPDVPATLVLEAEPPTAKGLPFSIITPGPSLYGIYRRQYLQLPLYDSMPVPSAEAATWIARNKSPLPASSDQTFLINFASSLADLPRVTLQQGFADNLLREWVAGRTIIIAIQQQQLGMGVHSPITPHNSPMTPAEFHAYALNTLLTGTMGREITPLIGLLLTTLATLLALLSYHRLPDQWSLGVALGGMMFYIALGWLLLLTFNLYLPLIEFMAAHVLGLTLMLQLRRRHIRERIIRLLRRLSGRLQDEYATRDFYETDEQWEQIANLVTQMLHMHRIMLLERVPGDHRLKEIKSVNCSLKDIHEMRRDYERPPYSTSIGQHGPLRLEQPYLTPLEGVDEIHYLSPLQFSGEVMGFWGFTLNSQEHHDLPALESAVAQFSEQIAELLHLRRDWKKHHRDESQGMNAWLGREGGDVELVADVQRSAALLEERLSGMEEVFHGQDTGTILYNLFGNVLHVNRRMSQLSSALNISPFNMNAVDFINHLTGTGVQECRDILRRVTLYQDTIFVPVTIVQQGQLAFMLQVRPLIGGNGPSGSSIDSHITPFPVKGVLIELTDVSQLRRLQQLKELLVENVFYQLRNDLESIVLSVDMLTTMELPPEQRQEVATLLKQKSKHTVTAIEKALLKLSGGSSDLFPVSPLDALQQAIRHLESEQSKHRVSIDLHLPHITSLTMAIPDRFVEMFVGVLHALLSDAAEQTTILIKGVESDCQVILEFSNSGFGIPSERFLAYMSGEEEPSSKEFLALRQSLREVKAWGGSAVATSTTGVGLQVTISLNLFICPTTT